MMRSARFLLVCCLFLGVLPLVWPSFAQQGAQVIISSPQPNETVRGLVIIRGSASVPNFQFFKVEYGRGASPTDWHLIGSTRPEPVIDGILAQWDTTSLPDGVYSLRLQAVKNDGNYQEYLTRQLVVANKRATETPTPTAAPTEPTRGPTATPGPTPTLAILQPTAALALPTPTPTPVRPQRMALPELPVSAWSEAFCMGATAMVAIFAVVGLVFGLRRYL
jgi:hypothetical protein